MVSSSGRSQTLLNVYRELRTLIPEKHMEAVTHPSRCTLPMGAWAPRGSNSLIWPKKESDDVFHAMTQSLDLYFQSSFRYSFEKHEAPTYMPRRRGSL